MESSCVESKEEGEVLYLYVCVCAYKEEKSSGNISYSKQTRVKSLFSHVIEFRREFASQIGVIRTPSAKNQPEASDPGCLGSAPTSERKRNSVIEASNGISAREHDEQMNTRVSDVLKCSKSRGQLGGRVGASR